MDRGDRDRLEVSGGEVDLRAHVVRRPEGPVPLTRLEARLLRYLVDHQDRPVSREELLREVWGYAPNTRTRTVENTVRRLRVKIEADPGRPRQLLSSYGLGYRFEPLDGRAVAAAPALRTNVAQERAELLGRRAQLAWLQERLREPGAAVIAGLPGAGKTALARELIRWAAEQGRWSGGAWLCELAGVDQPDEVERRVALVLGLAQPEDRPGATVSARLAHDLASRPDTLVVLDGADRLDPMPAIRRWVSVGPRLRILVTRRLTPALSPGEDHLPLGGLPLPDAIRLLLRSARRTTGPEPDPEDPDLARAVEMVGGLPLPLEHLGARVALLGVAEVARRERQVFQLLRSPQLGPEPEPPLLDAFEAMWADLDPASSRALTVIAAGPPVVTLEAAEEVLDRVELPGRPLALDVVQALGHRALLRSTDAGLGPILGLPPLLRTFARSKVAPTLLPHLEYLWAESLGRSEEPQD